MDLRETIERIVAAMLPERMYLRSYECTVEAQADDGTLDLLPDDERIRGTGLQGVKMHLGLPGVTVRLKPGARVLLQFVGGDPRQPYVTGCLNGSESIESISFDGGQAPVARQGDAVAVYWPAPIQISVDIPGLGHIEGAAQVVPPSAGIITGGAPRVKA